MDLEGMGMDERLVTGRDERAIQVLHGVIAPGGHRETELYSARLRARGAARQIEVLLHDDVHRLEARDTLTFPGREPHTWRNVYGGETVFTFTLVPERR